MSLKKILSVITGQKEQAIQKGSEPTTPSTQLSDLFPIYRPAEVDMSKYRKLPLATIATVGTALSQMPEAARSIVQTVSHEIATRETLFVGINPKGVMGYLQQNEFGTVGNIMRVNEQGKHVIAGRMRFKALEGGLPVKSTSATTIPFDPMTLMIAVACYLYSFATYLDIMLHKNFDAAMLDTITQRMEKHANRYNQLYQQCRKQIENYYQASIDVQIIGGFGNLAKALGNAIASVPVLKDGPVDELLINAGQSLSDGKETSLQKKLAQFSPLEDSRITPFIDNIHAVRLLYNQPHAMLTDGESLYVLMEE